jgi:hypothetical protein
VNNFPLCKKQLGICFDQNNDLQTNKKIKKFDEHSQMVTKCEKKMTIIHDV